MWGVQTADGPTTTVRIGDPCRDASDQPVVLADGARVGIAHALDTADLAPWAGRLDQPFPQLDRLAHGAPAGSTVDSLAGTAVGADAVPVLLRRGWRFLHGTDRVLECDLRLPLPNDGHARVVIRRTAIPGPGTILHAEVRGETPLDAVARFELLYDLWQAARATDQLPPPDE